jgi:hypothetical protein
MSIVSNVGIILTILNISAHAPIFLALICDTHKRNLPVLLPDK